jgi:hypothetical protein
LAIGCDNLILSQLGLLIFAPGNADPQVQQFYFLTYSNEKKINKKEPRHFSCWCRIHMEYEPEPHIFSYPSPHCHDSAPHNAENINSKVPVPML